MFLYIYHSHFGNYILRPLPQSVGNFGIPRVLIKIVAALDPNRPIKGAVDYLIALRTNGAPQLVEATLLGLH